jgi:hypothetical protein
MCVAVSILNFVLALLAPRARRRDAQSFEGRAGDTPHVARRRDD